MANPLFSAMNAGPMSQLSSMMSGDPIRMMESNPQTAPIARLIKSGGNPQAIFYDLCKQRGVDPNTILSLIKR